MTTPIQPSPSNNLKERHGMNGTPEYLAWQNMKARCYKKNCSGYTNYGGRGIEVCDQWRNSFSAFYAYMGKRPTPKHSIDRLDNDGNYEPSNCHWATRLEQQRNRRLFSNNTSGRRGVYWYKYGKKWSAMISIQGKDTFIGYFNRLEDAIKAREDAERVHYGKVLG